MGDLSLHAQIVGTILIVCLMIALFELIRRNHLQERYAVTWAVVLLMLLAFTLIPGLLFTFSKLSGVKTGAIAFLSLLSVVELMLLLHLSAHASKQNMQVVRLHQELAILQEKVEALSHTGVHAGSDPAVPLPALGTSSFGDASPAPPDDDTTVDSGATAFR
jgi:hypothetical protein